MHARHLPLTLALALTAAVAVSTITITITTAAARTEIALERAIAEAYRIDGWERIERIDFTFNIQPAGRAEPTSRQWSWWPRENRVTLHRANGEAVTYTRDQLDGDPSEDVLAADRQFINDSYWLLFPFQIVWSNPTLTHEGEAALPIGEGTARKVTVQYPEQGGYTPGDAYDLYLDERWRIRQWNFRRGGGERGSPMTWEDHRRLGPIIVSLDRRRPGDDGETRLWFTDVQTTLVDADEPVTPEPMER